MKLDLSKVEKSKYDVRTGVRIPKLLTEELAEFIGIMIGDGHVGIHSGIDGKGRKYKNHIINIAFDRREKQYIQYVNDLFYQLFNIKPYPNSIKGNGYSLRKFSKGIVTFLSRVCKVPLNYKADKVNIPKIIWNSPNNIKFAFLRGLADTDFSVCFKNKTKRGHTYPVIKATFKSKALVNDLEIIYKDLGFIFCTYYNERKTNYKGGYYISQNIYLNGEKNIHQWIRTIGFSNDKFNRKIEKWKKDGVCPPGYR